MSSADPRTGPGVDRNDRFGHRAESDDVPWLDPHEQAAWRTFMYATRLLFDHFERELQRTSGMPMAYYEVLVRLSEAPGRAMRMSELADLAQNSRSRLSHAVARLEEAGWVRRERCRSDRRGAIAVLTDRGFAALEAAAPAHVRTVRAFLFDVLSDVEVSQLERISTRVIDHLASSNVVCPEAVASCLQIPGMRGSDTAETGPITSEVRQAALRSDP